MKTVSTHIGKSLGIRKDIKKYTTIINELQSDKGFTITLNEAILDIADLIISTTISADHPIDNMSTSFMESFTINGEPYDLNGSGPLIDIDSHTYEAVIAYSVKEIDPERPLQIEYEITSIYDAENEVEGNWKFSFQTSGAELAADTTIIPLDTKFTLPDGGKIRLTEYTRNALGQKIYFTSSYKPGQAEYMMELRGTDNNDVPVGLFMDTDTAEYCRFIKATIDNTNPTEESAVLTLMLYITKITGDENEQAVGEPFTIEIA